MKIARLVICMLAGGVAWAQSYVISTYAGGLPATKPVPAINAAIGAPQGIATDAAGNVFFTGSNCVFKMDPSGLMTRVAGTTRSGYAGDGGPATNAQLFLDDGETTNTVGLALDSSGNLYIADTNNYRVRMVSPSGIITTVAGNGLYNFGSFGDNGRATNASIYPWGLAVDSTNNLYIADRWAGRVRKVSTTGIITTVAGGGFGVAEGLPATAAQLAPTGLAIDSADNLYVADIAFGRVRKISADGIITTVAGGGPSLVDGGSATGVQLNSPKAVAVDRSGNVYIGEFNRVRMVTRQGIITTIAGNGTVGNAGDGGPAIQALIATPQALAVDPGGNLFIADAFNLRIRVISRSGIITAAAGLGIGDNGPATAAQFRFFPWGGGLTVDTLGNLYIADTSNQRLRRISSGGTVTTIAGTGVTNGYFGDGGQATGALLNYPSSVGIDGTGNLYIADTGDYRVRKVTPSGVINSVPGIGGSRPLAVDTVGNVYAVLVDDDCNDESRVQRMSPDGTLTSLTACGSSSGDGGPAASTQLKFPFALTVDAAGNVYVADINDYRVRKVSPDGTITTVAGNGSAGFSGDGGPATDAQLNTPVALAIDVAGNLFVADTFNNRIRKVSVDGTITTIAGDGTVGYSGDGGPAVNAQFGSISGLALDGSGNLYISDQFYNSIRLLQPAPAR